MIKKRTPQKKKLQIEIKKLNQNDEQNLKILVEDSENFVLKVLYLMDT